MTHIMFVSFLPWQDGGAGTVAEFYKAIGKAIRKRMQPLALKSDELYLALRPDMLRVHEGTSPRNLLRPINSMRAFLYADVGCATGDAAVIRMASPKVKAVEIYAFDGTVEEFYSMGSYCHFLRVPKKLMNARREELLRKLKKSD